MRSPHQRPTLTEPGRAEELLALAIEPHLLGTPSALLVCCDQQARPLGHIHLLDCDPDAVSSDLAELLDALLDRAPTGDAGDIAGLLLGLTRPGTEHVQPYDRAWFRALYRLCHRRRIRVLGVYVVTRTGTRAVSIDDAA